ncbi:MAG: XisI protein [Spirulinaceae cyanobacterium]
MAPVTPVKLRQATLKVLQDYRDFLGDDPESQLHLITDEKNDHYLLLETGWHDDYRIYGAMIHIHVIGEKLWIQQDGTEAGIANELVDLGIPKTQIVLAYKTLERRKITEFAVA